MGGDYSRSSFDALRDYAGVLLQQGHPTLDADWNELVAIIERRLRVQTVDTIGRAVVPLETPTGFEIKLAAGPTLTIGRGRMYVDGLLAENHGRIGAGAPPVFDRAREVDGRPAGVLDEAISAEANDFVAYTAQPYLPVPPALPQQGGPHLAYLDVWRREVTPLKDPRLLEPALGGIDTATRWQTVWQVRVLENVGAGATCASDLAAWDTLIAPSPARLTTATIEFEDPDEPCLIPPGGGYRGLENQLYRVEIHTGGALGTARFKWSRDNASVGATIEAIDNGDRLEVRRIGRDSLLRFRIGDWVEITDDRREFAGKSGDIRRLTAVDEDSNTLTLHAALTADLIPGGGADTAAARHSRVIKWDQAGQVLNPDGTTWEDLDLVGSDGLIRVPPDDSPIVLEAGITVSFAVDPSGNLRALDHWAFAARTEGAQIEILDKAPPIGIHHHYARLAMLALPGSVSDCRIFWPPAFEGGEDCGCTICVSAEGHNNGTRTIQAAISQLPPEGGTVCLGLGEFLLGEKPVEIADRTSVRLQGHGQGTELAYVGSGGAIRVSSSLDVRISDLAVTAVPAGETPPETLSAIHLHGTQLVKVHDIFAKVTFARETDGAGIALSGLHLGLVVADNTIFAERAIAARTEGRLNCGLFDVHVLRNIMFARRAGISLEGAVVHLGETMIAGNGIFSGGVGVIATGTSAPVGGVPGSAAEQGWSPSPLIVSANAIGLPLGADGIVSGVPSLRVLDNDIAAGDPEGEGTCIRLVEGLIPSLLPDAQLIGNRLGNVGGFALSIEAPQASLLIKRNVIRDCGRGAITMRGEARARTLSLDNNVIERVAITGLEPQPGSATEVAIAVRLAGVDDARVIGNTVRQVGLGVGPNGVCAGFDMEGVPTLDFADNVITEIGPVVARKAIGLYVGVPIMTCSITSNRIADLRAPGAAGTATQEPRAWAAILVGNEPARQGRAAATAAPSDRARTATAFTRGDQLFWISARRLAPMGRVQGSHVRVSGNFITDAHPMSDLPLVRALLGITPDLAGTCTFTDNQCILQAGGVAEAIVEIQASGVVASNNVVRRQAGDAMHLTCAKLLKRPFATVIGNLTAGKILLNNTDPLPPEFAPLNVSPP